VWGQNPLEAFGGFHNLPVDDGVIFHSALGVNGIVSWSTFNCVSSDDSHEDSPSIELNCTFPAVDWAFQKSVYGWAALQYQAFARGFITVIGQSSCTVALCTDNVLEFAVNDKPYFGGDVYGFRRAPLILNLDPGQNKIDLRLIRDVRAMGGVGSPSISVRLTVQRCTAALSVVGKSTVLPDVINGTLASSYASVTLCNQSEDWINVVDVRICNVSSLTLFMLTNCH
jgi:hypothetical protein